MCEIQPFSWLIVDQPSRQRDFSSTQLTEFLTFQFSSTHFKSTLLQQGRATFTVRLPYHNPFHDTCRSIARRFKKRSFPPYKTFQPEGPFIPFAFAPETNKAKRKSETYQKLKSIIFEDCLYDLDPYSAQKGFAVAPGALSPLSAGQLLNPLGDSGSTQPRG